MVIFAIPSMGKGGLSYEIYLRFGRCTSFTFIEIEKNEITAVKAIPNHAVDISKSSVVIKKIYKNLKGILWDNILS